MWIAAFGLLFLVAFHSRLFSLWQLWLRDPLYGVGAVVPLISVALIWRKRNGIKSLPREPNPLGLLLLFINTAGASFLPSTGLLFAIYWSGVALVLGGLPLLRALAFPIGLLILVIPIPGIFVSTFNYPLQLLFAVATEWLAGIAGVSVIREGPILRLPNATLTVAPECNGLRTLAALFLIGLIFAHISKGRTWARVLLPILTVPIAYLANSARLFLDVLLVNALSASWWLEYERQYDLAIGLLTFVLACSLFAKIPGLLKCQPTFSSESSH